MMRQVVTGPRGDKVGMKKRQQLAPLTEQEQEEEARRRRHPPEVGSSLLLSEIPEGQAQAGGTKPDGDDGDGDGDDSDDYAEDPDDRFLNQWLVVANTGKSLADASARYNDKVKELLTALTAIEKGEGGPVSADELKLAAQSKKSLDKIKEMLTEAEFPKFKGKLFDAEFPIFSMVSPLKDYAIATVTDLTMYPKKVLSELRKGSEGGYVLSESALGAPVLRELRVLRV